MTEDYVTQCRRIRQQWETKVDEALGRGILVGCIGTLLIIGLALLAYSGL